MRLNASHRGCERLVRIKSSSRFPLAALCPMRSLPVSNSSPRSIKAHGAARCALNLPTNIPLDVPLPGFDSIGDALVDLAQGKFLVVLDDENRENEGDLIIAADLVTTEQMAFMVQHTSGVVCIGMEGKDLDRLRLPLMISSAENEDSMYTAFTVTVDLREGVTTGISASDRAATIRRMASKDSLASEFRRPGHIFPLRARPGGTLVRPGHTEASVDLSRLAGLFPAGALCEIVSPKDGSMARTPELLEFSRRHGLKCITIADLMRYRLRHEQLLSHITPPSSVTTRHGTVNVHVFKSLLDEAEHVVFVVGNVAGQEEVLVQVQHECPVADLLGCAPLGSSNSAPSVDQALQRMAAAGRGTLILMRDRSISLSEQSRHLSEAQSLAQRGEDDGPLDLIDYGLAAQMISSLGIKSVVTGSNGEKQREALASCGVTIVEAAPSLSHHDQVNGQAQSTRRTGVLSL